MSDLLQRRLAQLHRHRRLQRCFNGLMPLWMITFSCLALCLIPLRLATPSADSLGFTWLDLPLFLAALLLPLYKLPQIWNIHDTPSRLAGELDLLTHSNGLVMGLAETHPTTPDNNWQSHIRVPLENMQMPNFRWAASLPTLAAFACFCLCFFIPNNRANTPQQQYIQTLLQKTESQLDDLHKEKIIPDDWAEQQQQKLATLRQRAQTNNGMDQQTWQAFDSISRDVRDAGTAAAKRLAESLAAAERSRAQPEQLNLALRDISRSLAQLATHNPGMLPHMSSRTEQQRLSQALNEAMKKGMLTQKQWQALCKNNVCKKNTGQKKQACNAADIQHISSQLLEQLTKRKESLKKCALNKQCNSFLMAMCKQSGGVSRGPGHAPLFRNNKDRFHEGDSKQLAEGMHINPDGSITVAEQTRDAEVNDAIHHVHQRAAERQFHATTADARTSRTAPQHKQAVSRYFSESSHTTQKQEAEKN